MIEVGAKDDKKRKRMVGSGVASKDDGWRKMMVDSYW